MALTRNNRKRWLPLLESLGSSYWLVPSLMALTSFGLATVTLGLDRRVPGDPVLPWLYSGGVDGARAVLGTLAGSMITVAGVVFSITIVAMSLASQQFGPMLLRNFMHDRKNQVVLGIFVATFVYCMLILRSVRSGEQTDAFVPHLSTSVALVLGMVSLGMLIYFIHHIARSIRIESVLGRVASDLDESIEELFPEPLGTGAVDESDDPSAREGASGVSMDREGYLLALDDDLLLGLAGEHDVVVEVLARPHDFVVSGMDVFRVSPSERCTEELAQRLRDTLVLGTDRTTSQDVRYGIDQLVQLGLRALSPSLNDPLTARDVVDRIVSAIGQIVRRGTPSSLRYDNEHRLRVIAPAVSFEELLDRGLEPLRRSGGADVMVARHLVESADKLEASVYDPVDRSALHAFVQRVGETARAEMSERDWECVEPAWRAVLARTVEPRTRERSFETEEPSPPFVPSRLPKPRPT